MQQFNTLGYKAINVTENLLGTVSMVEHRINVTDVAIQVIADSCDLDNFINSTEMIEAYEEATTYFFSFSDAVTRWLDGFSQNMM